MKRSTHRRTFLVNEVQNGVVLYSTPVRAANEKSLWRTSMMRIILLNMSSQSILEIKEVKENG